MKSGKIIALLIFISIMRANLCAGNLLPNHGFEKLRSSGKPAIGWDAAGNWRNTIYPSTESEEGNKCVFFTSPAPGNNAWLQTGIKVKAGHEYLLEGWVKTNLKEVPDNSGIGLYIIVRGKNMIFQKWISGKGAWRKISGKFIAPQDAPWLTLLIGIKSLTGNFWIDNFSVKEIKK